ncbi:hypothetical protein HJD18_11870 [Thermoleophilia bacterium SCSIO 60948]|nr:hypothetical protein HJD18_11870 [Thermoleophilia bacterium SCSIO 60948]
MAENVVALRDHPDSWMHLPPEVERLVPALVARLGGRDERLEADRVEELVLRGDRHDWLAYLDEVAELAERAPNDPRLDADRTLLAVILADQYELIQAVLDLDPEADARRRRLRAIGA